MSLDHWRRLSAELYHDLAVEYHAAGCGLKDSLETRAILDRYAELADPAKVAAVTEAMVAATEPVERRRLAWLRDYLAWVHEARVGREIGDLLQNQEAAAEVEVDGETIPYRAAQVRLVNETDRARRERLRLARDAVTETFEPVYLRWWETCQEASRQLGYADLAARCAALGELPLEELALVAARLLRQTDDLYASALPPALATLQVAPGEATAADLAHLFRVTDRDDAFPATELLPRYTAMIAALGLDIRAEGRVSFDLEERPLKSPRPFCSILSVPDEVVLVLRPVGGLSDWAAFGHELGHALHFGYTDPALPWEFRHLGDNAVTEGYAFLFDRLTVDPHWLRRVVGLSEPEPLARLLALRELMMIRRYSAQFLFELDLWRAAEPTALKAEWPERMRRATGASFGASQWLASVDPLLYCARYLQGWLFEAVVNRFLRREYGPEWFVEPGAGQLLRGLWARGQDRPVRELFRELGASPLETSALLERAAAELDG